MNKPYVQDCLGCKKTMRVSDRSQKYHSKCKPPLKTFKYSADFQLKRLEVSARDNHKCNLCDVDLSSAGLRKHIHHIDGNTKNNDYKNLVTLCSYCHRQSHKRKIVYKIDKDVEMVEPSVLHISLGATGKNQFRGIK